MFGVMFWGGAMWFSVLGNLEVLKDGRAVPLMGVQQRTVLGYLLLHANQPVAVSRLMRALWPDDTPPTARKMLQNAVSGLRRTLELADQRGTAALLTSAPGYQLRVEPDCLDLSQFRLLVGQGRSGIAARSWEAGAHSLRKALALWRGPVLADLVESGRDWPEIGAVRAERLTVLEDRFEAELACGRHHAVVGELEALVAAEPEREHLCGQLMLALYRCGRQAEALLAYRRSRAILADRLGIDPGHELRELEQAILTQDPSLALPTIEPRPVVCTGKPELAGATTSRTDSAVELRQISIVTAQPVLAAERRDPERVHSMVRKVLAAAHEAAADHGGVVGGIVGSMVMVLFGACRTGEDDALRSVRAAMAVSESLRRGDVSVRIAVVSGEALVGFLPGEGKKWPVATGSVVDRCLELVPRVHVGEVWVCEDTRKSTEDVVDYRPCGDIVGAHAAVAGRKLDPTAGRSQERHRELEFLRNLVNQVRQQRRPHLVTVLGEPGIGKSRLVHELDSLVGEGQDLTRCLFGRTPAFGQHAATVVLGEIVASYAGILAADSAIVAERKLTEYVRQLVGARGQAGWLLSRLRPLVGLEDLKHDETVAWEALTACRHLFEEVAARNPLVLVFEDVHRADDALLDFLEHITGLVGSVPLLVVVTARPELSQRRPNWGGGKRDATTITLAPLSDHATAGLLRSLLEPAGLAKDLRAKYQQEPSRERQLRALLGRVGGNALSVVE